MDESTRGATPLVVPGPLQWLALGALVMMWGSRYYAVEIALRSYTPLSIVFLQLSIAGAALYLIMRTAGLRLPTDARSWLFFSAMALLGNGLPFFLESWGQVYIDSGLVGILMSVSPLSVLLLAHWLLPDEHATSKRSMAFLLGLIGVIVLIGPDALLAIGGTLTTIVAQLAVLLAAVCYGLAAVITRLAPQHPPRVTAAGVLISASVQVLPVWLLYGGIADLNAPLVSSLVAVVGIGLVCTALAALVFFYLIVCSGAGFQSLSNYLLPLWAVLIGYTLLDETLPANAFVALVLILLSLGLIQERRRRHDDY